MCLSSLICLLKSGFHFDIGVKRIESWLDRLFGRFRSGRELLLWVDELCFKLLFKLSVLLLYLLIFDKGLATTGCLLQLGGQRVFPLLLSQLFNLGESFVDLDLLHLLLEGFHVALSHDFLHGFQAALLLLLGIQPFSVFFLGSLNIFLEFLFLGLLECSLFVLSLEDFRDDRRCVGLA